MHTYLVRFLRQAIRILLPALIFFLTGAAAVQRQARGYRLETKLEAVREEIATLEARRHTLAQEVANLRSRERLVVEAAKAAGLRQPTGPEIVILQVERPRP